MKRITLISLVLLMFGYGYSYGQTATIPIYVCQNAGVRAVTSGSSSSNYMEGVVPACTVTVYLTGTTTKATIYKDSSGTTQNNPFTALSNGAIQPTYAAINQGYDVVLSAGIPPNTYTTPLTLTGLYPGTNITVTSGITQLTGDVTAGPGTGSVSATVARLKNVPFCTGFTPTNGQAIEYTTVSSPNPCYTAVPGSALAITALSGDGTASGPGLAAFTLATVNSAPGCTSISGTAICVNGKGLTTSVGTAFSISSFSCSAAGTFEVGYASTNPNTCTYGYTGGTPVSATLTDSASHTGTINSPYTSGTLAYAYSSNTTFYGNASSSTQTASQVSSSISFLPCTFFGLSTGGTATGATASGSATGNICANETATLTGLTGTLASNGLGNTYAGQSFVFASPGGSYPSLILTGGCGHTLTVGGFTTTFNTHAFTYTNIEGGSQPGMCVYTSPAPASIPTTVVVSSL